PGQLRRRLGRGTLGRLLRLLELLLLGLLRLHVFVVGFRLLRVLLRPRLVLTRERAPLFNLVGRVGTLGLLLALLRGLFVLLLGGSLGRGVEFRHDNVSRVGFVKNGFGARVGLIRYREGR